MSELMVDSSDRSEDKSIGDEINSGEQQLNTTAKSDIDVSSDSTTTVTILTPGFSPVPPATTTSTGISSLTSTSSASIDLQQFLMDTLRKNQKDRIHLLKIEKDLSDLVRDGERHQNKFGPMSSYHRMLVHRVAAFFGMEHNVDSTGNSVVVNKTRSTRIPDFKFSEYLKENDLCSQEPKKSILKRESSSFEEMTKDCKERSPDRRAEGLASGALGSGSLSSADSRRSKSFEEREVQYEKARARIFNQDSSSSIEGNDISNHTSTSNGDNNSSTTTSSSSGIVVSMNTASSSQSELSSSQDQDLKSSQSITNPNGSNNNNASGSWQSDPRPWSSTDSTNSSANGRPKYLRLQRQKRLPNSFDSDSTRTSFTTSSSMSSSSGMFLTPDNCLPDQPPCDSSTDRVSFTKANSFGGISHSNKDNSLGMNCETKLTKDGLLNVSDPGLSSANSSLFVVCISSQDASSRTNGSTQMHTWPKKQSKPNNSGNPVYSNNNPDSSIKVNSTLPEQSNKSRQLLENSSPQPQPQDGTKKHNQGPETVPKTDFPSRESHHQSQALSASTSGNRATQYSLNSSDFSSQYGVGNSHPSSKHRNQAHHSHKQHSKSNVFHHSSSFDRHKNKEKLSVGPQLIVTPVGGCIPSMMPSNGPVLNPSVASSQPLYYLPYVQTNPSAVMKPVVSHENHHGNNSRYKSGRHLANQMSNLSLSCHSSHIRSTGSENNGGNFSASNSHAPHGMANCVVNCGSSNGQLSHHQNSIDMNLSNSGYAHLTPMPTNHIRAQKSNVLPMNTVSSASPLCYIHPTLQPAPGSASSPSLRMSTPTGTNSLQHQNNLEPQVTNAIFTDRFNMSNMSPAQTIGLQNTYLNASNVQTAMGSPSEMDMIYQAGTPHQKSNLIFLGSQMPMDSSYQAMPVRSNNLQAIPQLQPMGAPIQTPPTHHPSPRLGQSPQAAKISQHPSTPNPNLQSLSASPNTQYPYALNVSLPYNSSQMSGTPPFSFPATIQGTPTMPMYVNTNCGSVLPGTSMTPHVMPGPRQLAPVPAPTQLPFPYQAPVYRPVPLFFLFNFQNKRGN